MRLPLPAPELVPLNKVRALDLQQELQREYAKREWREALQASLIRWALQGGTVQRVASGNPRRKLSGFYID